MGFLKDLSADISQAVEELIPKELLENDSDVVVNTLDDEPTNVDSNVESDYVNVLNNLDNLDSFNNNDNINEDNINDNVSAAINEDTDINEDAGYDEMQNIQIDSETSYIDEMQEVNTLDDDIVNLVNEVNESVSEEEAIDNILQELSEAEMAREIEKLHNADKSDFIENEGYQDSYELLKETELSSSNDYAETEQEAEEKYYAETEQEAEENYDSNEINDIATDSKEVELNFTQDNIQEEESQDNYVTDAEGEDIQEPIEDEIEEAVGKIELAVGDDSIVNNESSDDNYLGGMLSEYMNMSNVKTTVKEEEKSDMASQKNKQIDEIINSLEEIENGIVDDSEFDKTLSGKGTRFSMHQDDESELSNEVTVITKGTTVGGGINASGSLEIYGNVNGDVECKGKLTILGNVTGSATAAEVFINTSRFEGDITSKGPVKIGVGTVVIGDVTGSSAVIAGAIKGEVDITGPVILDSTAVVKGNVKGKSVQVNNGAVLQGFCSLVYADVDIDDFFEAEEFKK